ATDVTVLFAHWQLDTKPIGFALILLHRDYRKFNHSTKVRNIRLSRMIICMRNIILVAQVLNGYKWISAHYLSPIAANHFSITAENGNPQNSVIYQNPGWGRIANEGPTN